MKVKINNIYRNFDKKYRLKKNYLFKHLVNFSKIDSYPIHRWYRYVEGFSPKLVSELFDYLNINKKQSTVFDPFSGCGTTLLVAKKMGMKSIGFETNPFAYFLSKVKSENYSLKDIKSIEKFQIPKFYNIPKVEKKYELKITKNLFSKRNLIKIEILKKFINQTNKKKLRDILFLNLLTCLPEVSKYKKAGNGIKRKKKFTELDLFKCFSKNLEKIKQDLKGEVSKTRPKIINDTCQNINNYNIGKVNISLFSPPYLNCFDPFEVYKIELWIGDFIKSYDELRNKRIKGLTSHMNTDLNRKTENVHKTKLLKTILSHLSKQKLWDKRLPKMIDLFFYEMHIFLKKLYECTSKNGYCIIIIGNSAYGGIPVATDLLIAEQAEKNGFHVKEIIECRKNEASSQQYKKIGNLIKYIRESIVILKK